jgi:hypothetical protein
MIQMVRKYQEYPKAEKFDLILSKYVRVSVVFLLFHAWIYNTIEIILHIEQRAMPKQH